jgi:cysteine sulfinate desulfinase/cysteine desulfurase-like protein
MGIDAQRAHGALRLTAGRGTTLADIERAAEILRTTVERVRDRIGAPPVASA